MNKKTFSPRKWQEDCLAEFLFKKKRKFSIGAVPGAGKSKAAAWIMATLMDRGLIDMVIAVSPQGNKKQEWYEDFLQFFGIPLDPNYSSTSVFKESKFKGAILTYQGINENLMPDIRRLCQTKRVGVIADEPHHLSSSEASKWGTYFQESFSDAKYMVFLSGTYWREDKSIIPFLDYDDDQGRYAIDFEYDYVDSLKDGNSRKVEFEFYNPNIIYQDDYNDQYYEGPLSDVGEDLINKCYRKLVTERNADLKTVIQDALVKLHEVRTTGKYAMPNAGMIIFAPDTTVAESLRTWLHTDPDFGHLTATVVTSEDPNASDKIDQFKRSMEKVLIAVNMVSEGIDIPRLRVGVYFSVYKTFLFFMQSIVGRLIRVTQDEYTAFQSGDMQKVNFSHAFLLKHPLLLDYSKRVEGEIQQAEIEEPKERKDPKEQGGNGRAEAMDFSIVEVLDIGQKEYVTSGHHIQSEHAEELDAIFENSPDIVDPNVRSYLRMNIATYVQKRIPVPSVLPDPVMDEARLSDQIKRWKGKIGGLLISKGEADPKLVWQDLSVHFKKQFGKLDVQKADVPMQTLEEAFRYAKDLFHKVEAMKPFDVCLFAMQLKRYRNGRHN